MQPWAMFNQNESTTACFGTPWRTTCLASFYPLIAMSTMGLLVEIEDAVALSFLRPGFAEMIPMFVFSMEVSWACCIMASGCWDDQRAK